MLRIATKQLGMVSSELRRTGLYKTNFSPVLDGRVV